MGGSGNLLYIFTDALRSLRENLITTVLTAVTLGFSLAIFSLFLFIFLNLNSTVSSLGDRTQIVAYVKDSAASDSARLKEILLKVPGVKSAEFIPKEKALEDLRRELVGHESILDGVDAAPLPASFEIKVMDSFKNPSQVTATVERLKALDWIDDIQFSQEWVEKFSAFLKFIELGAITIGIFLVAATLFIISNTIRLAVYARRDEIEIMKLVGASDSYIKIPFFIEGVLQGVLGGVLALIIMAVGRYFLLSEIPAYFSFAIVSPVSGLMLFLIFITAGVFMGVAGSLISLAKFLKV